MDDVERWGIFEISLEGSMDGNPFLDVKLSAEFKHKTKVIELDGFYDGDGVYRVRFMPDTLGPWTYATKSNRDELDGKSGQFKCVEQSPENHGPVRVRNTFHFAYADGTSYFPVGTTCYAWIHQGDELEGQTLVTLEKSPFNKVRFCVFPKHYIFNRNEPVYHPFEGSLSEGWDFTTFNPEFFRHLEQRVGDLLELGIEADLILFHPYDRWGYATMDAETDDRYLRYVVARLSAYRSVWWSLANEYDLMQAKTMVDWDRFFQIIQGTDPYQHLRSIHNCRVFYDHSKPWVTHVSIQHQHMDFSRIAEWREDYGKPVIIDECGYEGNISHGWGNLPPQELVRRFWEGVTRGGYVVHGETYLHPEDILWWSKGGVLYGESPERIAFLRRIVEEGPDEGLEPINLGWDVTCAGRECEYYLAYFGIHQPAYRSFKLPEGSRFNIDMIDTWEMTITPVERTFEGECKVKLPNKPYMALRIRKEDMK